MVTSEDLRLAAEWLDCYDTEPEKTRMVKVAEWLRSKAEKREKEALYRAVAKETEQPISRVREVLRRKA